MDAGEVPEIHLADYFPQKWLPCFRVLKEALKFKDDVIVATIVCTVGAMLPPTSRVHGYSMSEKIIVWLFLIGTSGTAKSALMKMLMELPLKFGVIPAMKVLNQRSRRITPRRGRIQQAKPSSPKRCGGYEFPRSLRLLHTVSTPLHQPQESELTWLRPGRFYRRC